MSPSLAEATAERAGGAALLVDEVFPEQPVRQWVLSFPYPLLFLFASRPARRRSMTRWARWPGFIRYIPAGKQ